MLIPPWNSGLTDYAIVGGSLLLNFLVAALDRAGNVRLASLLFSLTVNIGIVLLVVSNHSSIESFPTSILFSSQLALSIMLAGMLLGTAYAFLFAAVNVVTVFGLFFRYYNTVGAAAPAGPLTATISVSLPLGSFLVLVVVITWLYQRALAAADAQLEVARKRIIRDELIRRDLAVARELQLRLFPPPPITNSALQIATRSEPARETSGDFYDFIELGDGQLGIVVADVTGKSVAAALMMALARVAIRSEARRHTAPADVLRAANETICRDHTARQMITAFYGLLDTDTLTIRFANAGHPYPILRRGDYLHEIELGGMPLGGRSDTQYNEHFLQLEPGDQLFLLSDGLIEERNVGREMFGYARLGPAILSTDPADPEMALEMLWQTVASFRGEAEQSDDITLMVLQVAPRIDLQGKSGA
ncbi:MAG: PP2C family protein-serine/threonine phosphatase [Chloroflexales bacterium]|nr:PP2C family protein-serine/threonine phosphatase [Chloroflexales bacterium]